MSLKERIDHDMREAMKSREKLKLSTIRLLKAAIKNREIEAGHGLSDSEVLETVGSAIKQRRESISQFKAGGRDDLANKEEQELNYLLEYLPRQLSEEEIVEKIDEVLKRLGTSSSKDFGLVMRTLMSELKGQVDGASLNKLVKAKLS